jgi:energy-coupling factor transport system ATP-binding protein
MSRIGDDVAFGCENAGVPRGETWERVRDALEVVGLDLPLDRSTSRLSGGQRQRLALAGVLAMRPGALVLDEPCANLDPDGVRQVHDAVRALLDATGATLLVVEHRIGTWLDLVDRLVLLEPGGGVVADGPPARVLAEHGPALTAAGVWVPGAEPARGSSRRRSPRDRAGGTRTGGAVPVDVIRPLDGVETPLHGSADTRPAAPDAAGSAPVDPLLSARGLATTRVGRLRRRAAARPEARIGTGIDLEVRPGRVLAVTGPNGVGKSTLGLTLAGLLRPADGVLRAASELAAEAGPTPADWTSRQLAARIGTVFQDPEHQFVARTVREELAVGPRALGLADVDARVDEVLDAFALRHLAAVNPFTLSGGEQRRLAIGTVVAAAPPVIVLDEPTSGQDRATWQAVVDRLGALADAGCAVVAVTHDRDLVRALDADEVVLGSEGARPVSGTVGPAASGAAVHGDVPDAAAMPGDAGIDRAGAAGVGRTGSRGVRGDTVTDRAGAARAGRIDRAGAADAGWTDRAGAADAGRTDRAGAADGGWTGQAGATEVGPLRTGVRL